MSSIKYKEHYYLNSSDRREGKDESFSYQIDIPKDKKYDMVCLVSATIPKSWYLVDDNQTFTLSENNVQTVITVPAGVYGRRSFAVQLQLLLTAGSVTSGNNFIYTVTTPNLSVGQPETDYILITVAGNGLVQPQIIIQKALYEQFGFNQNSTNIFVNNVLVCRLCNSSVKTRYSYVLIL